ELQLTEFADFEVFEQRHVKVHAVRIVEEVAASVTEGQSAGSYKLSRVSQKRTETLGILVQWLGYPAHHIRIRRSDAEAAIDPCVVGQPDTSIAGAVDYAEGRTRLKDSDSRELPSAQPEFAAVARRRRNRLFGLAAGRIFLLV